jgi:hypothetical protein
MEDTMKLVLNYKKLVALFATFSLIYLLQSLLILPSKATLQKYHLNNTRADAVLLTIAIPYIVVWLIAMLGYSRLDSYVDMIKASKDGAAFRTISNGIFWFALWLPISAIAGNFTTHTYSVHPNLTATMVMTSNYINMVLLVPAFVLVDKGAKQLQGLVRKPVFTMSVHLLCCLLRFHNTT